MTIRTKLLIKNLQYVVIYLFSLWFEARIGGYGYSKKKPIILINWSFSSIYLFGQLITI